MSIKDKISKLLKTSGKSLKTDLLPVIEMTEQGYYSMFRNDSLKVSTLNKISEFFNVPVTSFFKTESIQALNEPVNKYGIHQLERRQGELLKELGEVTQELNKQLKKGK